MRYVESRSGYLLLDHAYKAKCMAQDSRPPQVMATPRVTKRAYTIRKTPQACISCRRRKVKCNGCRPCSSCKTNGLECAYDTPSLEQVNIKGKPHIDTSEALRLISNLHSTLRNLSSLAQDDPGSMSSTVTDISMRVHDLESRLHMQLNPYKAANCRGEKSLEYKLASFGPAKVGYEENPNSPVEPALSLGRFHGLYSPLSMLSLDNLEKIFEKVHEELSPAKVQEAFFLLGRYFDLATVGYQQTLALHRSPIRTCAQHFGLKGSSSSEAIYDKLLELIPLELRQAHLQSEKQKDAGSRWRFVALSELFQDHCRNGKSLDVSSATTAELWRFFEVYSVISILSTEQLQKDWFSEFFSMEHFECLLNYIECRVSFDQTLILGRVVCFLVRFAIDNGLNRWEFYHNLKESEADHHRKLWWKCYWWDKFYAVSHGKLPLLRDEESVCLFPRCVMALGVEDSMSCETLIERVSLKGASSDAASLFGYIFMGKMIERASRNLLFARKYTTYQMSGSKFGSSATEVVNSLKSDYQDTIALITSFRRLFSDSEPSDVPKPSSKWTVIIEYCYLCLLLAFEKLILRLSKTTNSARDLASSIEDCQTRYIECARANLLRGTRVGSAPVFCALMIPNYTSFLVVSDCYINHRGENSDFDISVLCFFASLLMRIGGGEGLDQQHLRQFLQPRIQAGQAISLVICRICLQLYLKRSQHLFGNELPTEVKELDQKLNEFCSKTLDSNSDLWRLFETKSKKKSLYHETFTTFMKKKGWSIDKHDIPAESKDTPEHSSATEFTTVLSSMFNEDIWGFQFDEQDLMPFLYHDTN
ncbi:Zn(II)2Cys6 transcription factor [Lachancea thermotolerans CBS 6340]|uniref:KLTH0E05786p n=1 Tax=Lachancea thermotolerans (strain ATCC 56472 / CBS 6340 / NRRL Y-8284) TaxID=559295 RepID=C5DHN5_LACTC|nr:KLTH0E05786p [Lachancea thermotolerans CBS 6340]CAR23296.1 KLTH0E05786p [Lachancea thermotolerans CBS 6340]